MVKPLRRRRRIAGRPGIIVACCRCGDKKRLEISVTGACEITFTCRACVEARDTASRRA